MKHILHTTTKLIDGGGADLNIFLSMYHLSDKYKFSLIVGPNYSKSLVNKLKQKNIDVYVIDEIKREISPVDDLKSFNKIKKIIKQNNFDAVYSHNAKTGVLARLAARSCKVPLIIHGVHGMSFHEKMSSTKQNIFKLVERYVGGFTDSFVCVGEVVKNKMIAANIGKSNNYTVINSGMDLIRFQSAQTDEKLKSNLNINPNDVVFTLVGRLDKRKGQHLFLKAFKECKKKNPNIKAILVGDGPERNSLKIICSDYGIADAVIFTGYKSDVEKYLTVSDIVCLTSEWEGIPQVLVQAAAAGKPIITFDVDGCCEVVEENYNGYLIDYGDLNNFVKRMDELCNSQNLRYKLGKNSKNKVDDRWSIETMIEKTDKLYNHLLNR